MPPYDRQIYGGNCRCPRAAKWGLRIQYPGALRSDADARLQFAAEERFIGAYS